MLNKKFRVWISGATDDIGPFNSSMCICKWNKLGDFIEYLICLQVYLSVYKSDLVYPDYFVSSNNVGLAKYLDNRNRKYKERNSFQSKGQ